MHAVVLPAAGRALEVRDDPPEAGAGRGGGGAHFCLGASLARMEIAELIDETLDRELTIEVVGAVEFVDSNFVNRIEHLEGGVR